YVRFPRADRSPQTDSGRTGVSDNDRIGTKFGRFFCDSVLSGMADSWNREELSTREDFTMAAIAVHEFITLDGVFEEPSWTFEYGFDPKMGETIGAITERSSTILLGRRPYEMFAPAWRDRTVEDDPGAPFFNETEKFVVGAQPLGEEWANTTALGAYDPAAIRHLKQDRDGVIYISGSGQLVRALLSEGLVDEL